MLARPPGSLITARPVGLVQTGARGFPEFIVLGARPPDSKLAEEELRPPHIRLYGFTSLCFRFGSLGLRFGIWVVYLGTWVSGSFRLWSFSFAFTLTLQVPAT